MGYCVGTEEVEGILVINDGVLTFVATKNTATPNKLKSSANLQLKRKLSSKEGFSFNFRHLQIKAYEKQLANFELKIELKDIAECKASSFPAPCKNHFHKNELTDILQLIIFDHGDL